MYDGPTWPRRALGDRPAVLAHRGGRGPWRENTIEAFRGALSLGADGVELDVRRTADGAVVVHHDSTVEGLGNLHELGSEDLPGWLPTLGEALRACAGATVNVEIKNSPGDSGHDPDEGIAFEVLAVLEEARRRGPASSPSRVVISSFSSSTISALASCGTEIPLGQLVAPSSDASAAAEAAAEGGCSALHLFHLFVTNDLVSSVHDKGMAVVAWTVNEPEQLSSMLEAGVDAVITDDVGQAHRVVGAAPGLVRDPGPRGQSSP